MKQYTIVFLTLLSSLIVAMDRPKRPIIRQGPVSDTSADSILKAAAEGRLKTIQRMIAEHKNLNQTNIHGDTPLILAARKGHVDVVEALLKAGAKRDIKNNYDQNAMFAAVENNEVEVARALLKAGESPNQREDVGLGGGRTLLIIATDKRNSEMVRLLLEAGADAEARKADHNLPVKNWTLRERMAGPSGNEEIKAYIIHKKEKIP